MVIIPENSKKVVFTVFKCKQPYFHPQIPQPTIIYESKHSCLAYARKLGVEKATSEYIAFVDSDVILAPNHLSQLLKEHQLLSQPNQKHVVVEGVLCKYSSNLFAFDNQVRGEGNYILNKKQRGFTHNTLTKRKTLIDWKPPFLFALEDLMITRYVYKKGGLWFRYIQSAMSFHIDETSQFRRATWVSSAKRVLYNRCFRQAVKEAYFHFKHGIKNSIFKRDIKFAIHYIGDAIGQIVGHLAYDKYLEIKK